MKRMTAMVAAVALTTFSAMAQEAPKQTVEGAHNFLSLISDQGNMKIELFSADMAGYSNFVRGSIEFSAAPGRSYAGGSKSRSGSASYSISPLAVKYVQRTKCAGTFQLDSAAIDARREKALRDIKGMDTQYEHVEGYSLGTLSTSQAMDWMKIAGVKRENKSSFVVVPGVAKFTLPSEELATRVQYAMEFIRNACDATAATGF
jgi:hypothetical protein